LGIYADRKEEKRRKILFEKIIRNFKLLKGKKIEDNVN